MTIDIARQTRLRRLLKRYGYELSKSRVRYPHAADYGMYAVLDGSGEPVCGRGYSATLEEAEAFLDAKIAENKGGSQ